MTQGVNCVIIKKREVFICILCLDWMKEQLNISERRTAANELLMSAKTNEEYEHIAEILDELDRIDHERENKGEKS